MSLKTTGCPARQTKRKNNTRPTRRRSSILRVCRGDRSQTNGNMYRVLAIEGVEDLKGKTVFKGLFGDDLVIVEDVEEKPEITVATKLTTKEYEAVKGWADKFGESKSKFVRDCIRQQMKDLMTLNEP